MMHLLLGVKKNFESDGVRLLKHVLHRYGVFADDYKIDYCYWMEPPTIAKARKNALTIARSRLEEVWLKEPGPIIGFGWMPQEILLGCGKTKLKNHVGTCWTYQGNITRTVWITYDPAAALFDPNVVVDISAVVVAAGKRDGGLAMQVNKEEVSFDWSKYL
jgi:hypothetical protein